MPVAACIELTPAERKTLVQWRQAASGEHRLVERARIILLASDGLGTRAIARQLQTRPARVSKWRQRFLLHRLGGLADRPRTGKPARYGVDSEKRILTQLDQPPPSGHSQWSGPLLARALPTISDDQIWRVLRNHKIQLQRRRSWCISTDPEFAAKAADVVGLYLNPPENAVVLCVDEKPQIQILERAQGWIRLPDGRALNGFNQCYKRHGTTTLFAALEVASGEVQVGHYHRRRRREFSASVVHAHPSPGRLRVFGKQR